MIVLGYLLIGALALLLVIVTSPAHGVDSPGTDALCALLIVALWPLAAIGVGLCTAIWRWSEWREGRQS